MAIRQSFSSAGSTGRSRASPIFRDVSPSPFRSVANRKETPKILRVLSFFLERLIAKNELEYPFAESSEPKSSMFHAARPPSISVAHYLERIYKYADCNPFCFVVGYVYIDRLVHLQPAQPVTSLNVHRLLVTSVMVAAKILDDVHHNNAFYAKIGGISNAELNKLELDLLLRLDFRVQVSLSTVERYCGHLEEVLGVGRSPVERFSPVFRETEEVYRKRNMDE